MNLQKSNSNLVLSANIQLSEREEIGNVISFPI